jgi:hypothetical protein
VPQVVVTDGEMTAPSFIRGDARETAFASCLSPWSRSMTGSDRQYRWGMRRSAENLPVAHLLGVTFLHYSDATRNPKVASNPAPATTKGQVTGMRGARIPLCLMEW